MFLRFSILWLFLLWIPGAMMGAQSVGASFSFSGPEVLKTDWSTRAVKVADLNGDGREDLALINNDSARLELYFQRDADASRETGRNRLTRERWNPELEDARFDEAALTVGFPMFDLVAKDLNGDGRVDFAYTAREVPLTIRCQGEDESWQEARTFNRLEALGWVSTLDAADLDGDGDNELVVLSGDAVRVFHPDAEGEPGEPQTYYLTGENPFNLMLADVSGDDRLDLLYISTDGEQALTIREQLAEDGTFGPERRFQLERPVREIRPMPSPGGGPLTFITIHSRSGALDMLALGNDSGAVETTGLEAIQPEIYPVERSGRSALVYGFGDLDRQGRKDVLVADPAAAAITFYPGTEAGFGTPARFPSFARISSLAVGDFGPDGQRSLAVVSAEEGLLGISRFGAGGRLSFPREISLEGAPVACAAFDADADGIDELAVVLTREGDSFVALLGRNEAADGARATWTVREEYPLEGVRRVPEAIREVAIFADNRPGLMVFVPREPPVFLSATATSPFALKPQGMGSSLRESFLDGVRPARISVFDVNRDGMNELVVGKEGFARALTFDGEAFTMVDQFNARRSEDAVHAVIPMQGEGAITTLMLYVPDAGELQLLRRGDDGVFRFASLNPVGRIKVVDWFEEIRAKTSPPEVILAGEDRFWRLSEAGARWQLRELGSFETELEDVGFNHVESADFEGDGTSEIIAVDGSEHVVEILNRADGEWRSVMYWRIFEQDMHYQGRTGAEIEPREVLSGDFNGDDLIDFLFLVHDRILIYPQARRNGP